jgi:hypothetical protein
MIRAYGIYLSFPRVVLSFAFSFVFALEGLGWLFMRAVISHQAKSGFIFGNSPLDYGPLNLFCAGLVFCDYDAIHLRNPGYNIAWTVKIIYLLFTASLSSVILISQEPAGLYRTWLMLRLLVICLWICTCSEDLMWWKDQKVVLTPLPGLQEYASDISGSAAESRSEQSSDGSHQE